MHCSLFVRPNQCCVWPGFSGNDILVYDTLAFAGISEVCGEVSSNGN